MNASRPKPGRPAKAGATTTRRKTRERQEQIAAHVASWKLREEIAGMYPEDIEALALKLERDAANLRQVAGWFAWLSGAQLN